MRSLRSHLTYANVMATLLLVLVLGGASAYASKYLKLKKNSVGTKQLREAAVTNPKLAAGAVGTASLADGAVTSSKIALGSVDLTRIGGGSFEFGGSLVPLYFGPPRCDASVSAGCDVDLIWVNGLQLHASCAESGLLERVVLSATESEGSINMASQGSDEVTLDATDEHQGGFGGSGVIDEISAPDGGNARMLGSFVYRKSSTDQIFTVDYQLFATHAGGQRRCEIFGRGILA